MQKLRNVDECGINNVSQVSFLLLFIFIFISIVVTAKVPLLPLLFTEAGLLSIYAPKC